MAASMEDSYPNAIVLKVEEAIPLMIERAIEVVCNTKFYDKQFLNTDVLQKEWPIVESCLREYGVVCTLDLVAGKMEVSKTKAAEDEDIIFKAIDILHLLSRNVPARWAIRTMDCSCEHEIINIGNQEGGICKLFGISHEKFLARRNILIGVVKELSQVTGCGIFGKGNTIAVLGSLQGIKTVKKIVEDCIAHDVPPAPRVRRIKKKTQPKKDARIKMTSQVMMSLESLCV
ncbi:PREDICTED: KRR1 small subunit processome component homolog [Fragaria vesca subsp. vesca]|uniref:KRR1 small subunit processome component homolog n=1 Tax=Fragaria vesca subsp. vesca TaxID=101020 RepID=UPI0002C31C78|nr:PREDICTED: KRR1 small subunit processome component homolog [Fragaria vesca subsp. vesca]